MDCDDCINELSNWTDCNNNIPGTDIICPSKTSAKGTCRQSRTLKFIKGKDCLLNNNFYNNIDTNNNYIINQDVSYNLCPVDCVVSEWSNCSATCGSGTRTRTIITPGMNGGNICPEIIQTCNTQPCIGDCVVSEWSKCSVDCGTGIQNRNIVEYPRSNGASCPDLVRNCNTQLCPVDCSGNWTDWSTCNKSCGTGKISRTFKINNPVIGDGKGCEAKNGQVQQLDCNTQQCPVDCSGNWTDWSTCSKPCASGIQSRTFNISTLPLYKGNECIYADKTTQLQSCNTQQCHIDCSSNWTDWSSCDAVCSINSGTAYGKQSRTYRVNINAQYGGQVCETVDGAKSYKDCSYNNCRVDCSGNLSSWSTCANGIPGTTITCPSRTSTTGTCTQSRTYNVAYDKQNGGVDCSSNGTIYKSTDASTNRTVTQNISYNSCPVDCSGNLSSWSTCANGIPGTTITCPSRTSTTGTCTQSKTYNVAYDKQNGGTDCSSNGVIYKSTDASTNRTVTQNTSYNSCPVDCAGNFSSWSTCENGIPGTTITCPSRTSATGTCTQSRTYNVTYDKLNGGADCSSNGAIYKSTDASNIRTVTQNTSYNSCPVDCAVSDWGGCSVSCGGGIQTRSVIRAVANGGNTCPVLSQSCNTQPCPINCSGYWYACQRGGCDSYTTQSQYQTYKISTPAAYGGNGCPYADGATQPCSSVSNTNCRPASYLGNINCVHGMATNHGNNSNVYYIGDYSNRDNCLAAAKAHSNANNFRRVTWHNSQTASDWQNGCYANVQIMNSCPSSGGHETFNIN